MKTYSVLSGVTGYTWACHGSTPPFPALSKAEHRPSRHIQRQKCKIGLPLIPVNTNKILIGLGGLESISFRICQPGHQVMFGARNAQHMTHLESVSCLLSLPVLNTGLGSSQGAVLWWEHFGLNATSVRVQPCHRVWLVWHIPGTSVRNCLVIKCPRRSVHLGKVQIYRDILVLLPTANGTAAKVLIYPVFWCYFW